MLKIQNYITISLLFISLLNGKLIYDKPNGLYDILTSNNGWNNKYDKEGLTIAFKNVANHNVSAILIKNKIEIPLNIIQDVIMDVNNYSSILKNSRGMMTDILEVTDSTVIAYQFIPINIPFMDHRHYYFSLKKNELLDISEEIILADWHLIDQDRFNFSKYSSSAVFLKHGAGIWMAKNNNKGDMILSYRIFMDPNGSIPNFIIDKINEISIVNLFQDVVIEAEHRFQTYLKAK